jgi:transposase
LIEAACWSHGRRKFFELAQLAGAPLAIEAVHRIDAIFDIERAINGCPPSLRLAIRQQRATPLVASLESWMRGARSRMSRHAYVAKAIDYMLKRWEAFTRFLSNGRICLSNNAAERTLRGICPRAQVVAVRRIGSRWPARRSNVFTHDHRQLNRIDPGAWLADVLARIGEHPASRLDQFLPWNWRTIRPAAA